MLVFDNYQTCPVPLADDLVSPFSVDTAAPVITNCPSDITQASALNQATQVFWTAPTATDASEFTTSVSHFPGTAFPVGSTTVTYLFTDTLGNSHACSFTVNVLFGEYTF